MAGRNFPEKPLFVALVVAGAFLMTHAHAAGAEPRAVRSGDDEVTRLLVYGARNSSTFAGLVAQLAATPWLVFVERGKCPASHAIGCLLHRVGRYQGQPYLRVLVDHWRLGHPHLELSTIAHELQHALEVAQHATDADIEAANIAAVFRRIGKVSAHQRRVMVFETEAARRVGHRVLTELSAVRREQAFHRSRVDQ